MKFLTIAFLLQVVWGVVPTASKYVIDEIPVELYITLRWSIAAFVLFLILLAKSQLPKLSKDFLPLAGLGIMGYCLASFGSLYCLKLGGVANFALLGCLSPVITATAAIFLLNEKPKLHYYLALPLCVVGLVFIVFGKYQLSTLDVALGAAVLYVAGSFLEGFTFSFSKKFKEKYTPFQYMFIAQSAAVVVMLFAQVTYFQQLPMLSQLSVQGWSSAILVSLLACVGCFAVFYWLLRNMDGHKLALFDGIHSLSALCFGLLVTGDVLNRWMVIGGTLLLLSLTLGTLPLDRYFNRWLKTQEA